MRFNSVRSSDFSQSAKAVNKATDQIFDAAMSGKPDFTKISQEAIKGRSLERRTATEAEGAVAKAGLDALRKTKLTRMKTDTAKEVSDIKRPAKRMAGIVAGLGAITTGYVGLQENKKAKAEREELRGLRAELDAKQDLRDQAEDQRHQDLMNLLTKQSEEPTSSNTDNTSTTPTKTKPQTLSQTGGGKGKSNWGALSTIIRTVEGTMGDKGYTTRFGGHQFDDLSAHPNIGERTSWGTTSEAAGAYQFMKPTWDEVKAELNLPDFSRESQEKGGRFLTQRRGVNPDARFNTYEEFTSAISKLSPEWAGLPNTSNGRTGYHGQANASMQDLWTQYQSYFN